MAGLLDLEMEGKRLCVMAARFALYGTCRLEELQRSLLL